MVTKFYQHVLALAFAIGDINQNPKILPNISLGFHIYDSYYDVRMTYRSTLDLLYKLHRYILNYECDTQKHLIAVIGGLSSEISFYMADLLGLYKIPQLTYGSFAPEKRDTNQNPSFYRMVPNEAQQYVGIAKLLQHFRWTWVGLFAADDDSGEHFVQVMKPLLSDHGICLAFIERILSQWHLNDMDDVVDITQNAYLPFNNSKASTVVLYGDAMVFMVLNTFKFMTDPGYNQNTLFKKVWIMTVQVDIALSGLQRNWDIQVFHGALLFTIHSEQLLGFQRFLHGIKPYWAHGDGFVKEFWEQAFNCLYPNPKEMIQADGTCTGVEKLESLPGPVFEMHMTGHSLSISNAVYAVAHALNAMHLSTSDCRTMVFDKRGAKPHVLQPWEIHRFLQSVSFNNSAGETVSFNENIEMGAGFDITNLVTFRNSSFARVKVGRVDPNAYKGKEFIINDDMIVWQRTFNQGLPLSLCNDYCYAGYHKKKREGEPFCCYDCSPCPEGEISNQKDMTDCIKCPIGQYPSEKHNQCFDKTVSFLSFQEPLGITFTTTVVAFSLVTIFVLGIFVKHRDTPIVRANNRTLTYDLLISLLLCFFCPLLFLGLPTKWTCFLRQPAFGFIFSMAVSCVLAKTVTVVIAFMATKPGSKMRKWVGGRLFYSILLPCSFNQAAICVVWLATSPPFPDLDKLSLTEEIIAECNEGSVTMFFIVLGYLGLLSIICLTVAFFARKLPNSFNEAKFITFSMLVFCSVWLSFIPSYLSTKGKYMVAVEIFAILASSAGLLCCIFVPKCYIILLRPELNNKKQLIRRKN